MKAIAINEYGGPETLALTELPDPRVGPDSVLVRARAAGVNPVDWKITEGRYDAVMRVHFPLVPGWDVAGVVERAGPAVTEYAPGDEVVGYVREDHVQCGTFAELVAAPVRTLARKPASLGWREAAGLPLAGLTAYQSVRAASVGEGDTVVVHAAAGGVGAFAVQIAVARGARVIGTAGEHNHEYLRSLGAEPVVYGEGLAERVRALAPGGVDAALDFAGSGAVAASRELDAPEGRDRVRIVSVTDPGVRERGGVYVFVRPDTADLTALGAMADRGELTVNVHESFPLAEAGEAFVTSQQGHTRGKIVLEIDLP